MLANNAHTIKTQRDQYTSQIPTLQSQVSTIQGNLTNMTKDRDNWKNIANSRVNKTEITLSTSEIELSLKLSERSLFVAELFSDIYGVIGYYVIRRRTDRVDAYVITLLDGLGIRDRQESWSKVNGILKIAFDNDPYIGTYMKLQYYNDENLKVWFGAGYMRSYKIRYWI